LSGYIQTFNQELAEYKLVFQAEESRHARLLSMNNELSAAVVGLEFDVFRHTKNLPTDDNTAVTNILKKHENNWLKQKTSIEEKAEAIVKGPLEEFKNELDRFFNRLYRGR
jgi:hypothetical protein